MARSKRSRSSVLGIALACSLVFAGGAGGEQPQSGVDLMRQDALLRDVCCIGSELAWAVGDRGVIWHTNNGGKSWQMQRSPVRCGLHSVCFLDESLGWAVGGWTQAYTHISHGVVLHTTDGGKSWRRLRQGLVPTLYKARFFDEQHGAAFGGTSPLFPSGVFTTEDGGKSWTTVPADEGHAWLAGDFVDPHTGALAGRAGASATLRRRSLQRAASSPVGLRSLRKMQLAGPTDGWLVGDGGLVLQTGDLGQSWQTAPGGLPEGAERHFDLAAVFAVGERCWVAGSPGTRVFFTGDGGRNWVEQPTGNNLPIHDIAFADDGHTGWAVGALGTILATRDAGKTWHRQRSGGTRSALLGVFSDPERVPLEVFAQLSGADGYLGVVDVVGRRDLDRQAGASADLPERTHEAAVEVGASGAQSSWRFPVRQQGLGLSIEQIVATLDRAADGRALEMLEAHVVRQIRTWRPEVLLTHHASAQGDDPLGHLVNQIVLRSAERAADPTSHVELATAAGLPPWKVKKVFGALGAGHTGSITLNTSQLEARLGCSVADHASQGRAIMSDEQLPVPIQLGFRLLVDHIPQGRGERGFFSGIALSPGGEARRMLAEPAADTIDRLRRTAQKRRNMQALIERGGDRPESTVAWLGQVGNLTHGLDPSSACQVLHQLAMQYHRDGHWELAAGTLEALAERYPQHPLAQSAQRWLLQYYASGEAAWRLRHTSGSAVRQASATARAKRDSGVLRAGGPAIEPIDAPPGPVAGDTKSFDLRFTKAAEIGKSLERTDPVLLAKPSLRFSLASAHRKLGLGGQANRYFLNLRRSRTQDAWWACAQGEDWLAQGKGEPPKPNWIATRAANRPHLDGQLDEAFWKSAKTVSLRSALRDDAAWPAEARLAYDDEFIYLAVLCRKAPGATYRETSTPRTRDTDLAARDRVALLVDLDRDYATYYQFTLDHRGWAGEACWGDRTWNPTWYIASADDEESWTAEVAIPLSELTGQRPRAGHVWAVGVQRTVPGVGFQSWSQPAGTKVVPAGFGYLHFR